MDFLEALEKFAAEKDFLSRTGAICVALQITHMVKTAGFPLDPDGLKTPKGGQVKGLSGSNVKKILATHGEERVFSREGGRTNRGAIDDMGAYVTFLNAQHEVREVDFDFAEQYWANKATAFLDRKPFKLKLDTSLSTQAIIGYLMKQAFDRQATGGGTHQAGALMQHLVGAKLDCLLGLGEVSHNSFTTSDDQQGRSGDFEISSAAIHVTTSPSPGLIQKCKENLNRNKLPLIISSGEGGVYAEKLAEREHVANRIEFIQIEQFIATNVLERSLFDQSARNIQLTTIIDRYNEIIEEYETQQSLKIDYE